MGLFQKLRQGLLKTHVKLVHELKRIATLSPKLTGSTLEELEAALLGADLGVAVTNQILAAVKQSYETPGRGGVRLLWIAQREVGDSPSCKDRGLREDAAGIT